MYSFHYKPHPELIYWKEIVEVIKLMECNTFPHSLCKAHVEI